MLPKRSFYPQAQYVKSKTLFRIDILVDYSYYLQFRSPQLLMVSGIGPRATLETLDIPVLADLAGVGQNMWVSQCFNV